MSHSPFQGWRAWHPNPPVPCTGRLQPPCVSSRTPPVPRGSKIPTNLSGTQQGSDKHMVDMELCVSPTRFTQLFLNLSHKFDLNNETLWRFLCLYLFCENGQTLSQGEETRHWTSMMVSNSYIQWCKYLWNNELIFSNISLMIAKTLAVFWQ